LGHNFSHIEFVTYMTIYPDTGAINDYIKLMKKNILAAQSRLWITGKQTKHIDDSVLDSNIMIFDDFKELLENL